MVSKPIAIKLSVLKQPIYCALESVGEEVGHGVEPVACFCSQMSGFSAGTQDSRGYATARKQSHLDVSSFMCVLADSGC